MTTTLGLFGTGRLGSAIRDAADTTTGTGSQSDAVAVAWAVGREAPGTLPPVDVAIDVSHPDAVPAHLDWARATGTPLVIGTTGWDPALVADESTIPVLVAPNFSLGVALLRRFAHALGGYAASLPVGCDLAVTETHHRNKVDAPSGTAIALRAALARGAGRPIEDVQTTSLRLGAVVGEHEVVVTSNRETLSLRHLAHRRELFADGALAAARWLRTRPAGPHTLDDLAEDTLRTVFSTTRPTTHLIEEGSR